VETSRPTPARFDETLALLRAADVAVYGDSDWTAGELRAEWDELDTERDAWLVDVDGRLAGVGHLSRRSEARYFGDAYVHPELTGRGVGTRLLDLFAERVRDQTAGGAAAVLQGAHLVGDPRAPALFAGRGYTQVRSSFRMTRDVSGEQAEPVWPDGLELRPLEVERDGPVVHEAIEEAFAEEWGHTARPYEEWRRRTFDAPGFDPALVPIAWDGDEIAGLSLNYHKRMGDWGWIGSIGVRGPWRRRGLGLALLYESFRRFRDTGETVVALGVDAENPTGAVRLYERAGMRVLWRADVWERRV
jgi:mycothiol synthase